MKAAILVRTNSITSQSQPLHHIPSSPTADKPLAPFRRSRSIKASFSLKTNPIPTPLRRSRSDTNLIIPHPSTRSPASAKWVPPATDVAEDTAAEEAETYLPSSDMWRYTTAAVAAVSPAPEEVELTGDGTGKGSKFGGGGEGDDEAGGGNLGLGDYYKKMLETDPGNSLLLRNYGKFLHEVAGDVKGAEECYCRAILSSPGDGEVLAMYGGLVWVAHRDGERAGDYFRRAVESSPEDCYVLGSYANFLWDSEEDEEESIMVAPSPSMVKAY